ncbi:hypothetical protein P389DRAFT_212871 [Cystobasidium minutum MCA 4210]|uniref:uncharacterized protein n=1 Tax=Cystobasidium minutum MCA 4210 TaxID=1397322 RepID=UPI0034CD7CF4|eukprot:jgi/Rhomi1/212871/estExt_Genemark1.C_80078
MSSEELRDAGRMSMDESPVASTSTSSADATAPAVQPAEETTTSGTQASSSSTVTNSADTVPDAGIGSASTTPAAESSSSTAAPAKTEPEIRVWKPVAPGTMPKPPELPESYYTPTPGQLRAAYAGQSNQLKKMGVDVNFSSRAQREKEERERQQQRASRWPKTIVRIRFHDRHQIETTFLSSRTMEAVYAWTKSILDDSMKKETFTLYVPPRIDYKLTDPQVKGKTLLDLQMAPSVVFLVRWQNSAFNDANKLAPIRPDLLALAQDLPRPPSFDPTPEDLAAEEKAKREAAEGGKDDDKEKGKSLGGAKAPKWLKGLGGKK